MTIIYKVKSKEQNRNMQTIWLYRAMCLVQPLNPTCKNLKNLYYCNCQ